MGDKRQVNLYEAKTRLSQLVKEAAAGATIVIAKDGVPTAQLVSLGYGAKPLREPGMWAGKGWIADDFNAPLPPDVQAGFDGEDPDPLAALRVMVEARKKETP